LRSFGFEHTPPHGGAALDFFYRCLEQLGYAEGYKFLENRKMLITSVLGVAISALWGVIHGSNPCAVVKADLNPELDSAALEAFGMIAHGKNDQSYFPSVAFVATFLVALPT
jgi:hypothetical protein